MLKSKNKIQIDYNANDIYKFYCKQTGNPKKLTQTQFTTITKGFFTIVVDKMIHNGYEMIFPKKMGSLRIEKFKPIMKLNEFGNLDKRKLVPNFKACKDLWSKLYPNVDLSDIRKLHPDRPMIYHENKHTDGFRYRWRWDKRTCLNKIASIYKIDIARDNDRLLAKALKNPSLLLDFYMHR